jgi:hypothetical protein
VEMKKKKEKRDRHGEKSEEKKKEKKNLSIILIDRFSFKKYRLKNRFFCLKSMGSRHISRF